MIRKLGLLAIVLLAVQSIWAQVTFVVNQLPDTHDYAKPVYISGDFEGWSGGNDTYKLTQIDNGYTITLSPKEKIVEYKFTQGSWDTVEYDANGNQLENRKYIVTKPNDTIFVKIASWTKNVSNENKSTASKNVSILSEDFYIPQLDRKRRVWIYLPPDYKVSNQSYPVLYMHDGQNIFDSLTSYSGEWQVDETLDKLYDDKNLKLIVVAVDNGQDKRLSEYSPWSNPKYDIGEGEAYMDFLTQTLKPYIDSHFRTLTDANNTGIMGSSMGGLISQYAALKYPDIFGKIGVFSPAFWYAPKINNYAKSQNLSNNQKIYFLAGGKEGEDAGFKEINQTVKGMNAMVDILKQKGFPSKNIQSKIVSDGKHNEALWEGSFEESILWLFKSTIKPVRTFKQAYVSNDKLYIEVSDGTYNIQFYTPEIIETNFIPTAEKTQMQSHAVVLEPSKVDVGLTDIDDVVTFSSKGLSVKINKQPFKITYWYNEKEVISEKNGYRKNNDFETLQFDLTPSEVLYGAGARALGMNRRGYRLQLYNRAHYGYETHSELMNFTMPLVLSSKKYLVHFDNAPIGYLDLDSKKDNTLTYETITGRKTYQIVVGNSWYNLIDNYTNLTGKQPMLPRWALGNFSSRFGYHSQKEVEETINTFKTDSIPVDAVILDLYWFGKEIKGTMGNLEVYKDSFPDFTGMVSNLKDKGVKTVLISEPFVLSTSNRWNEAVKQNVLAKDTLGNPATYDFYFGNTGLIDVYNPQAKQWFWNIYKDLANKGVAGIWGDLGEPEVHPTWVRHTVGTADEVHNIYGHDWAKLVYEGYAKDFPDERPFILMRAGYSGSQHYGMIPWSGDVNRTWGGLQSQPEIALQMGMQGMAYMHSDLGGFAGANLDDELYIRWLQYGVFQPIFRPHAQEEVPSEPVFREATTKQLAKQSIELRYKLLPYNYNLVFQNHKQGTPLMRPLFFEDKSEDLFTSSSTYLWGDDFLVTPILESGVQETNVYFPKNNVWFDFYSDEKVKGGQSKTVTVKQSHIPTFVRAGAFIPMVDAVQSTDDYTLDIFDLHYYNDTSVKESKRSFYNDDGLTKQAYEKGIYEILNFKFKQEKQFLEMEFEAEIKRQIKPKIKQMNVIIHNIKVSPKRIKINGKTIKNYQFKNDVLTFPVTWHTSKKVRFIIKK